MTKALEPVRIGTLALSNRIVRSATSDPLGNLDGTVSEKQIAYYRAFGENGVGLILTAMAATMPECRVKPSQNSLFDDSYLSGHIALTQAVHETPAKVICQLSHAGARGMRPLAPSAVLDERTQRMPEEMTQGEIDAAVRAFADAAVRAKRAGYDGVQLHGAHGYLLCSFLNPELNLRTDEYGGSAENRFRIVARSLSAVREAVGPDYPVWVRFNSNIVGAGDAEYANDLLYQARRCKALGADLVELSGADYTALGREGKRLYYLKRAAWIKEQADVPVALVGGIRSFSDMDEALSSGISLVGVGRPFICEPDLITRLKNGQPEARCVSCNQCFRLDASYRETGVRCALWEEKQ